MAFAPTNSVSIWSNFSPKRSSRARKIWSAARELLEETGYEAREVVALGSTRPNPAIQDNWIHTFLARDVEYRHEPLNDGTERTRVRLVPLESVPALITEGRISHSLVVVGFHLLGLKGGEPPGGLGSRSTSRL